MFWSSLHRMILLELIKVFGLALCALTGLILMAGIISEAMKNGLGPTQILLAIPLMLPSLLPYTVPTTTLFATCIVYGRLSADNEILALKSAGVHIIHVISPALLLGTLTSAGMLFLYLDAIPHTSFVLKSQAVSDVEETLYTMLRKDRCLKHPKLNYEIDIHGIEGRKLQDVIFKRRAPDGKSFDFIARAKQAELHVDADGKQLLIVMWQCQIVKGTTVGFLESNVWPVDIPAFLRTGTAKLRTSDMTWFELFEYEERWQDEKEKLSEAIDRHQAQLNMGKGAASFRDHIASLMNDRKLHDSYLFNVHAEWHMRAAIALGCFCFALVGCPIGIWFSKSDYLSAFITCFLPIVTVYYPVMFCAISYARAGKGPPWATIYIADFLMLLAGAHLFRRLARN
ncbi:MAG: LptF/LptG family permease [Planctomycetes bacterium]|nr:LptF/LptG family permease [Planctomycetota bacterium]